MFKENESFLPKISVVIPVKPNGSAKVVLDSLRFIDYPQDRIEIIVSEGRNPSKQRNEAVKQAEGEIIYFLDNDSIADKNLFKNILECYKDGKVVVVGGPSLTKETDSLLQKCFGYVLSSVFGTGPSRHRYFPMGLIREVTEKELILCNFSVRRNIFEKEGGFDLRLYPNEENEFLFRLKQKGYRLIYHPLAFIFRSQRRNIFEFSKQFFTYGRGRMEQFFIRPSSFDLIYLIPLFFCLYLIFLVFQHHRFISFIPLLAYFNFNFAASLLSAMQENRITVFLILFILFLIVHISYGMGLIWGIFRFIFKLHKNLGDKVEIKRVKAFGEFL